MNDGSRDSERCIGRVLHAEIRILRSMLHRRPACFRSAMPIPLISYRSWSAIPCSAKRSVTFCRHTRIAFTMVGRAARSSVRGRRKGTPSSKGGASAPPEFLVRYPNIDLELSITERVWSWSQGIPSRSLPTPRPSSVEPAERVSRQCHGCRVDFVAAPGPKPRNGHEVEGRSGRSRITPDD
jgi:hypothetical protein